MHKRFPVRIHTATANCFGHNYEIDMLTHPSAERPPEVPEPPHNIPEAPRRGRLFSVAAAVLAVAALAGCTIANHGKEPASAGFAGSSSSTSVAPHAAEDPFLIQTGDSLIALHQNSDGGWKFQSQIQSPHFQTDRDVGAASVGMGFLALADRYPQDSKWLNAAKSTASWLMAVENKDSNGNISWPDYVDGGDRASSRFTSFDDGALGVGDFFWRLYKKTGDEQYKATALGSVNWTLAQAENVGSADQPVYRWVWDTSTRGNPADGSDNAPSYQMGMGEGVVGIVSTLATYYQRTQHSDPAFAAKCKQYAEGGVRFIQSTQRTLGENGGDSRALPETGIPGQDGDTNMNSGYLSGAAGAAYMYLNLYKVFGDKTYLDNANATLSWLQDTQNGPMVNDGSDEVSWDVALDPQGSDSLEQSTGIEEGGAGTGEVFVQAASITGNKVYLTVARKAGNWLLAVASKDSNGGYSWRQDMNPGSKYSHPNLNNGAAGIGTFLYDLYRATGDKQYLKGAQGARTWLIATAAHDGRNLYWNDVDVGDNPNEGTPFRNDPSWHWGDAGIIAFLARLSGGSLDVPGEQDALTGH